LVVKILLSRCTLEQYEERRSSETVLVFLYVSIEVYDCQKWLGEPESTQSLKRRSIQDAIIMASDWWEAITATAILNCWYRTDIPGAILKQNTDPVHPNNKAWRHELNTIQYRN